jgi:hypothetical protein
MVRRALSFALLLAGCIADPELKRCIDVPAGADGCASPCEVYCETLAEHCPGELPGGGDQAARLAACRARCNEYEDGGDFGDTDGDTLQCRTTFAARAAGGDTSACAAAGITGGDKCVDGCATYCRLVTRACPDAYPAGDTQACLGSCAAFPTPLGGASANENSLACRVDFARRAQGDPETHCPGASMLGGGRCGDVCEGYCDQVERNCGALCDPGAPGCAKPSIYADRDECLRTCAFFDGEGDFAGWKTEDDSVQCRAYHASFPATLDPVTHCPHSEAYNPFHCGKRCDQYCRVMGEHCGNYADDDACRAACDGFPAEMRLFPDPASDEQCLPKP